MTTSLATAIGESRATVCDGTDGSGGGANCDGVGPAGAPSCDGESAAPSFEGDMGAPSCDGDDAKPSFEGEVGGAPASCEGDGTAARPSFDGDVPLSCDGEPGGLPIATSRSEPGIISRPPSAEPP